MKINPGAKEFISAWKKGPQQDLESGGGGGEAI